MRITAAFRTDQGQVRANNQDNLQVGRTVFAVADGMGGHVAGEVASEEAVKPLKAMDGSRYDTPEAATEALREAVEAANSDVIGKARSNPDWAGMGTTLTAVLVRDEHVHLAHVGDSRAYLYRDGALSQLTTDHTLVEQLVQEGRLSREEIATHPQRSVITRAIGVEPTVDVDTLQPLALQPGDRLLLCSDGLTGPVDEDTIAGILGGVEDPHAAVDQLVDLANTEGGPDNITVVLLSVTEGEPDPAERSDGRPAVQAPAAIPIRPDPHREHHNGNWASDMGRLADRQGVDRGAGPPPGSGRVKRLLAVLTGALVLAAVVAAGAWLIFSRAWFVGAADGEVAIFQGLPEEVAGIALYRISERSGVALTDLPPLQRQRVVNGVTTASLGEAQQTVATYRENAAEAQPVPDPAEPAEPTEADAPQRGDAQPDDGGQG